MAISKDEAKMLENVLKSVVSKLGGGTENPVKKILRKRKVTDRLVGKPVETGRYPMYSDWAKSLYMTKWDKAVDYGRARSLMT